jgi:hypothetical protein
VALRAIMAGEEDDAKQRLQRFIHSLDWAALTTLEQLIKTRKKTLKLSRELEASLQEEWDTEHPDGVNGMRRERSGPRKVVRRWSRRLGPIRLSSSLPVPD